MTFTDCFKTVIEDLPGDQFTQAWKCIEEIDAALEKAGPVALLALNYTRAVHEERTAQCLAMQHAQIATHRRSAELIDELRKANKKVRKAKSQK